MGWTKIYENKVINEAWFVTLDLFTHTLPKNSMYGSIVEVDDHNTTLNEDSRIKNDRVFNPDLPSSLKQTGKAICTIHSNNMSCFFIPWMWE